MLTTHEDVRVRTDASLQDRRQVFRDRLGAGARLARLVAADVPADTVVFGLAPGGLPVAWQVARYCGLPLEIAVAAPVLPPWNGPAYGAIAWDGTVMLDQPLFEALDLDRRDAARALDEARSALARSIDLARGGRPPAVIADRPAILVDDGNAPLIQVEAAAAALRNAGAGAVWIALPTQTRRAVQRLAAAADRVYCVNLHLTCRFDAAQAYLDLAALSVAEAIAQTHPHDAPGSGPSAAAPE